jgi:hypothetical protein
MRDVTANTTMLTSDDVINVTTATGNVTITLPYAADCKGRTYRVVKANATAHTVTLDGASTETIDGSATLVISAVEKYVGVSVTSNGVSWTSSKAGVPVAKTTGYTAIPTDTLIHCDTYAAGFTVTLYAAAADKVGKKLRIANINGTHNVTVAAHAGAASIRNNLGVLVSSVTVAPGRSINLVVNTATEWKDLAADIQSVTTSVPVGATNSVVNANAASGNIVITLPTAASRFAQETIGPLVCVAKVDTSPNTVSIARAGSDTIDGSASSLVLTAPGMVCVTATGATTWVRPTAAKPTTTASGTATLSNSHQVFNYTGPGTITLPSGATYKTIDIHVAGGTATINPPANVKLYTSSGEAPAGSVTIAAGRSATFTYSAEMTAWIRV